MQTLFLLQAAGPLHQQPVLEQLLLDQISVFEPDLASDFPHTPAPLAGEWQSLWRPTTRVVLLEAPVYPAPSAEKLAAERAALYGNTPAGAVAGAVTKSAPAAPQLPAVGRLFSLQSEPDAQLLLRMYQYAISPQASQAELLAFLPLGLMKGAWVWGEVG
ncbi:MAG: hypothetical protein Q8J69_08925 [Sphingobacteriaceae bacterium]|nr:hypothetical protein [Sphingobacteriaceae bacterium]